MLSEAKAETAKNTSTYLKELVLNDVNLLNSKATCPLTNTVDTDSWILREQRINGYGLAIKAISSTTECTIHRNSDCDTSVTL